MKLSFVIPAYNEEKYICDCLQSIFNLQNLPETFEAILADSNSTDHTRELVASKFPQVKTVVEKKPGPAAARNAGARAASGEYLAFIDADCRLPQNWWQTAAQEFKKSEKLVALQGPYYYFEAKTRFQKLIFFISNVLIIEVMEFLFRRLLRLGGPAYGGNTVAKRLTFEKIGGFNEKFEFYGDDIDLLKRMMKLGKVKFLPKFWVYSSNRRLRAEGTVKMWLIYTANTWSTLLFNRPIYKKYQNIR